MIKPDCYTLPFRDGFDVPIGGVLECRGTRGWLHSAPGSKMAVRYYDDQANSTARTTGGMIGSLWTVVSVQPEVVAGRAIVNVALESFEPASDRR